MMDPVLLQTYRQSAQERQRHLQEQMQTRLELAWKVAHRAAEILYSEFGVTKVVAFGSITQEGMFHCHSDVDLAVWDLPEHLIFRAIGVVQSVHPSYSVDVIIFEEASPGLKAVIEREGIPL